MTRFVAALLLLLLPALGVRATPVDPPMPDLPSTGCGLCNGKGLVPCPHPWESLKSSNEPNIPKPNELDIGPLKVGGFFCSACMDLECCRGLGWKPCEACASDAVKALRMKRIQAREDFLAFRRKVVDGTLQIKPLHILTPHYELVFSLKPMAAEVWMDAKSRTYIDKFWFEEIERLGLIKRRVKPSQHFLAHLYARRLEECYEQFCERFDPDGSRPLDTELTASAMESYTPLRGGKARIGNDKMAWADLKAGTPIREWVFLLDGVPRGNIVVLGGPPQSVDIKSFRATAGAFFFSFYGTGKTQSFGPDDDYHQYVYHNVAELLVHDYTINGREYRAVRATRKGMRTPYNDFPDWFHEAWARVQEMDRFGRAAVHCTAESPKETFQAGTRRQYLDNLKKWLGAKRLVPLPEITRSIRDNFSDRVHTQIWYIVDYLRRRDPLAFPKLVARTKMISCELNDEREGFTRALDEVYGGLTPMGLEEAWREDLAKQR